jgi:hypothetical protein
MFISDEGASVTLASVTKPSEYLGAALSSDVA